MISFSSRRQEIWSVSQTHSRRSLGREVSNPEKTSARKRGRTTGRHGCSRYVLARHPAPASAALFRFSSRRPATATTASNAERRSTDRPFAPFVTPPRAYILAAFLNKKLAHRRYAHAGRGVEARAGEGARGAQAGGDERDCRGAQDAGAHRPGRGGWARAEGGAPGVHVQRRAGDGRAGDGDGRAVRGHGRVPAGREEVRGAQGGDASTERETRLGACSPRTRRWRRTKPGTSSTRTRC